MLNASLEKNILLGKHDATKDDIEKALKQTNSKEFVQKAGGIDKIATNLSGGQK